MLFRDYEEESLGSVTRSVMKLMDDVLESPGSCESKLGVTLWHTMPGDHFQLYT